MAKSRWVTAATAGLNGYATKGKGTLVGAMKKGYGALVALGAEQVPLEPWLPLLVVSSRRDRPTGLVELRVRRVGGGPELAVMVHPSQAACLVELRM